MEVMFSGLASRYSLFNSLASLGLDRLWRGRLVRATGEADSVLDIGTGTGEVVQLFLRRGVRDLAAVDISEGMLEQARRRLGPLASRVVWKRAGAEKLPFEGGRFAAVASAFVLRNLRRGGVLETSLREMARVLRPGGKAVILDLTRPRAALLRWGHGLYTKTVLPLIGRSLFGSRWPGNYLTASIEELPPAEELGKVFRTGGFASFRAVPLWGGIATLFIGEK
jgi:demethylmenaquinone methyltransferase/2-methoxy-6-polyprenyl-1,4-benzoquinol methylase